ncbi:MAG: trypsin-like peptidase domain-containing protein [Clostridium sp.]|nr:trypsin-like peptidase domain-containing protein [Clostridium sp.]MCM1443846.1 trypsin-like peptidase domain-containing protein [Candidatus Amulumruptor caecigallinarius]
MKKIIPYAVTSLTTLLIAFCGLFVYKEYFYKEPEMVSEIGETVVRNITLTESDTIKNSIEQVYDAVVLIESINSKGKSSGTGFVYKKTNDSGYILTNNHVITGSKKVEVTFTDGNTYEATVLGSDVYSDVAVLKVDANSVISVATIGRSEDMSVGDSVFTVGSPLGYVGTVTKGILSGKDRQVTVKADDGTQSVMEVLQTDAAINPGNSGGPLVNLKGEVIGINSLKLVQDEVEGMGFAIPIELVMTYVDTLETNGKIERPAIGVETISVTDNKYYLKRYNIDVPETIEKGVVIINIISNSPASKVGFKRGDIILKIDGVEVENSTYMVYLLYKYKVGDTVTIEYYRDNAIHKANVTLGKTME